MFSPDFINNQIALASCSRGREKRTCVDRLKLREKQNLSCKCGPPFLDCNFGHNSIHDSGRSYPAPSSSLQCDQPGRERSRRRTVRLYYGDQLCESGRVLTNLCIRAYPVLQCEGAWTLPSRTFSVECLGDLFGFARRFSHRCSLNSRFIARCNPPGSCNLGFPKRSLWRTFARASV